MVDTMNMDAAPTQEKDALDIPEERSNWKVYLKPKYITVIISHNKLVYGTTIALYYLLNFVGCCACVNLYSDVDRLIPCDITGTLAKPEEASKVLDFPLMMLAIWHIIEWIRTTVLLTVICIGVNWTAFWYVTMPNTIFGLVVYALVHMSYLSDDGKKCSEIQENRGTWLLAEIIGFWVCFFVFAFPFIFTCCMGKERADATLKKAAEEAEEEE